MQLLINTNAKHFEHFCFFIVEQRSNVSTKNGNGVFVCMCVYACVRFQNGDSFIRENGEIFWLSTLRLPKKEKMKRRRGTYNNIQAKLAC